MGHMNILWDKISGFILRRARREGEKVKISKLTKIYICLNIAAQVANHTVLHHD